MENFFHVAKPARLPDGDWGAWVKSSNPKVGEMLLVVSRKGGCQIKLIAKVLQRGTEESLCKVSDPLCASCLATHRDPAGRISNFRLCGLCLLRDRWPEDEHSDDRQNRPPSLEEFLISRILANMTNDN